MTKNSLTNDEFRFLREALRGGAFDNYGCGCRRMQLILLEILDALDADEDADLPYVNADNLIGKLERMSGAETGELVDRLNRCYFAESVELAEAHEADLADCDRDLN